jgi:sigma-E factor negative regulatory protein RseA
MTTQQDEHFSAFMDGELDDANSDIILNKLCKDENEKQRWHRYHIISDTLTSKLPDSLNLSFSASVMSAIENEPAIFAPKSTNHSKSFLSRRFAGAAIAASVAVVAIMSVNVNIQPEQTPQLAQMPTSDEFVRIAKQKPAMSPVQAGTPSMSPVQAGTPAMTVSSHSNTNQSITRPIVKMDPKLQQYIINHSQRISGGQLQGILPYARIVVSPVTTQDR